MEMVTNSIDIENDVRRLFVNQFSLQKCNHETRL
jgi:hypothetical protein